MLLQLIFRLTSVGTEKAIRQKRQLWAGPNVHPAHCLLGIAYCRTYVYMYWMTLGKIVWPQWWSFADVSQQGLDFSKKNQLKKNNFLIWLSQMFTGVVKKCLNLTFKVNFLCQKSFESFWIFFSLKNISLGPHFL